MTNAHDILEGILSRLQAASEEAEEKPRRSTEPGPKWQEKLKEAGYPDRHIQRLASGISGHGAIMAETLWQKIKTGDALILLLGRRGTGKTLMACEWAKRRIEQDKSAGKYTKCADIIGEIKATWGDGGKSIGTERDVLRKYRTAKYLVIDEFHEKGVSDWESRTLINILDHRYDAMLATVLISNLSETDATKTLDPGIIDRANETGGLVLCEWESYRK